MLVQKFSLGVPHYRFEQHIADQGVDLDRGVMCRCVEEAGSTFGATAAWFYMEARRAARSDCL